MTLVSQGLLGSAVRGKTRDCMERITITAVLDDLLLGAFIAQFSCNSCHT